MRILKSHPLFSLINGYLIDSPQPSNISYLWNFGSLLGFCLVIQIVTGVTLAMHYNPSVLEAFNSVEHIMRDVNNGWLIRYLHSNTASAFFFLVYLHIGRGLYYGSYKSPRTLTWGIGTVILIVMMATAFLGYGHSPKWFNISISFVIILILVYYTIQNLVIKNKVLINPIGNSMKNTKYNKLNKSTYYLNKRRYSTISSSNNSIEFTYSERLNSIIKELGLNPFWKPKFRKY